MSAVRDPITREVIASSLGSQWNDRVVQIFATRSEMLSGVYTGWAPVRGSLGYAEDSRCLYEVVDFGTDGLPVWWPVAGRGVMANFPEDSHLSSGTVSVPGSGAVTTLAKLPGEIRYGRSYGFSFACTVYTPSGNLGLWTGEVFVQLRTNPNFAIGTLLPAGWIKCAGQGWAGGVYASSEISGFSVIGPMNGTHADCEFIWRGWSYPGMPDLLVVNPLLTIVEIGGGL